MNLKTGVTWKQSMSNFPKNEHFLPPWYTNTYIILRFALLPYYRRIGCNPALVCFQAIVKTGVSSKSENWSLPLIEKQKDNKCTIKVQNSSLRRLLDVKNFRKKSFIIIFARIINGARYSRMDQVNFWKTAFKKLEVIMVCLSGRYHFKLFKGCLPKILLGPF